MAERQSKHILRSLQQQWRIQGVVYCLLLALSVSLLLTAIAHQWLQWPLWTGVIMTTILFGVALFLFPYWRITLPDITSYLDSHLPQLEESCGLLLKPSGELGPLEKLQAARTEAILGPTPKPRPLRRKLLTATCLLAGAGIGYAIISSTGAIRHSPGATAPHTIPVTENNIPGIRSVNIRITPPAYTGKALRQQQQFNLQVEEGAMLDWEILTDAPADSLQFIFNDTLRTSLTPKNRQHTRWSFDAPVRHPGFYQVALASRLSELYRIEVIRDEAPHILIRNPKPYTVIDIGESQKIPLVVKLQDDYGIADAAIVATIASGSGEAVKFKEQTLRWTRSFSGAVYDLQKTIDLAAMGLKPGDELYFYCWAKDNHEQEARSDMYIISLPDTARLMSLEGLTMGVDNKPEYFRSQRQIILETEQLLKEKDTIARQTFNDRSNNLGFDQKLLRLRYGKFLGEEAEEGGGGHDKDTYAPEDFGNAAKILDAYTDKHDNAEDATYFEPAIKAQLKATLTEMWNAELRLRTYKPAEALPYAYKALRLLKDLQQKSRAYVAKTGVRITPLDPAKRLSGKLEAVVSPLQLSGTPSGTPGPEDILRISLTLLEQWRKEQWQKETARNNPSLAILLQASRELSREAAAHPAIYLPGYQAMRRILGGVSPRQSSPDQASSGQRDVNPAGPTATDMLLAQQAIRKMLPEMEATLSKGKTAADAGLSQLYFHHINDPIKKQ